MHPSGDRPDHLSPARPFCRPAATGRRLRRRARSTGRRAIRPLVVLPTVLVLVALQLVVFSLVRPATVDAATPGNGAPFDCTGGSVYVVQRGATSGTIWALDTTNFAATVPAVAITTVPGQAQPNALGITRGGSAMYTVAQSASGNSVSVYKYDPGTQTWATFPGTATNGDTFVAGAVDPFTGIYYYANYNNTGHATVYGFNTATDTAVPGVIATIAMPITSGTVNGDMAFDLGGNLYVVESGTTGTTAATGVVEGPMPTSGNNTALTATTLKTYTLPATQGWNGIAFDNFGQLFIEYTEGTATFMQGLNPNTGATINAATQEAIGTANLGVDLAACSLNPTLELKTNLPARSHPTDQFNLALTGGGLSGGNTATTTGTATGLQPVDAGPVIAVSGTSYTVSESGAGATSLADYTTTYSCTDAASGNRVVASGAGTSFTLNFPTPAAGATGPYVTCVFTNTPTPAVLDTVKRIAQVNGSAATSGTQVKAGDVVTYQIVTTNTGGSTAGTVLSDPVPTNTSFAGAAGQGWSCPAGSAAGAACTQSVTVGADAAVTTGYTVRVVDPLPAGTATVTNQVSSSVGTCSACSASNPTVGLLDTAKTLTAINGSPAGANPQLSAGDLATYSIRVANSGGSAASTALTDTVPANTSYAPQNPEGWSCAAGSGPGVGCTQTVTVTAGGSTTVTYTVRVSALPAETRSVTNTVASSAGTCSACTVTTPTSGVLATAKTLTSVNGGPAGGPVGPGDVLGYAIAVSNSGGSAGRTVLTETVPAGTAYTGTGQGWVCADGGAAGATCSQTVTVPGTPGTTTVLFTVTVAAALPAGTTSIVNTVASSGGTCVPCTVSTATVAALTIDKTLATINGTAAPAASTVGAGDTLGYAITVANAGGTAGSTTLTETVPAHTSYSGTTEGWTCPDGGAAGTTCTQTVAAAVGGHSTVAFTVTVDTPLPDDTAVIANTVTASIGSCAGCSVSNPTVANLHTAKLLSTVNGNAGADRTVTTIAPGDVLGYAIGVANAGGSAGTTLLTETVPQHTRYSGSGEGWSCATASPAGTSCTQQVTSPADTTRTVRFTVTVDNPLPSGTPSITNTVASSTGTCAACTVTDPTVAALDTVKTVTAVDGRPATGATQVTDGDTIQYAVVVTNTGGSPGASTVTDPVPAHTHYAGPDAEGWSCAAGSAAGTPCRQTLTVPARSSVRAVFSVRVDAPLPAGLTLVSNQLTTSAGTCSACRVVNPTVGTLSISKTVDTVNGAPASPTTPVTTGDVVVYRMTLVNSGGSARTTTLHDKVPTLATYTGPADQGWSCPAPAAPGTDCAQTVTVPAGTTTVLHYTMTVGVLPPGTTQVGNSVAASTGECTDCVIVLPASAALQTTKTLLSVNGGSAGPDTSLQGGDVAVYRISTQNTGGTTGSVTLTDTVPAATRYTGHGQGWSCPTGSAAGTTCRQSVTVPGGTAVAVLYTVTLASPVAATLRHITNTVTTQGSRCTDCTVVNPVQQADLAITKTVDHDSVELGTTVTFTVRLSNLGPDAATEVSVADTSSGLEFVSVAVTQGGYDGQAGVWHVGRLDPGQVVVLTMRSTVRATASIDDVIAVDPAQADPDPDNNHAEAPVTGTAIHVLPNTGVPAGAQLWWGLLLLVVGAGVLVLSRRRSSGRHRLG